MRFINVIPIFFFFLIAGCVPGASKSDLCPTGQTFNQATRSCGVASTAGINTGGPVNTTRTATILEDTNTTIYLGYSDPDGDLATSCTATPLKNLAVTVTPVGTCACDSNGVCKVILKADTNEWSSHSGPTDLFTFQYRVTTASDTSTFSTVTVTVDPVDDAILAIDTVNPLSLSSSNIGLAAGYLDSNIGLSAYTSKSASSSTLQTFTATEDQTSITASIIYADFDGGSHTISVVNAQNLTVAEGSCTSNTTIGTNSTVGYWNSTGNYGICYLYITKAASYNGPASVQFQINSISNGVFTPSSTYTISGTFADVDHTPVNTLTSAGIFTEETEKMITLTYTDADNDPAISCAVNFTGLQTVNPNVYPTPAASDPFSVSTACSCTAGICTVGLTPRAHASSTGSPSTTFSFNYNVTTQRSVPTLGVALAPLSFTTISATSVTNTTDNPFATTATLTLDEDATTSNTVTLGYIDPDVPTGAGATTTCSVSSPTNGTLGACTCTAGACSTTFTPTANFYGTGTFSYTVTRGSRSFATAGSATVTVNSVLDAPTLTIPSTASTNMNTPVFIPITMDEGGGTLEDSEYICSATGAPAASCVLPTITSTNTTLVPTTNVSIVTKYDAAYLLATHDPSPYTADVGASTWYLKVTPEEAYFGTSTIGVTIRDSSGTPTTTSFVLTVNPVYAIHKGWKNIKATGAKIASDGTTIEEKKLRLEWEDFEIYGSTIAGYNVYKGDSPSTIDYSTPINGTTPIPASQKYYEVTDSSFSSAITYKYLVRPVDATYNLPILPFAMTSIILDPITAVSNSLVNVETGVNNYGIIDIRFPPDNMALLHRWAVNKEICQKMGQTPTTVPFSCTYTGPGDAASNTYDFAGDAHVDMVEMGCPYSENECGADGCIGSGSPNTIGCGGGTCVTPTYSATNPIFYYDRTNGSCYYNTSSTQALWEQVGCPYSKTNCSNGPCYGPATGPAPSLASASPTSCSSNSPCYYYTTDTKTCYKTTGGGVWSSITTPLSSDYSNYAKLNRAHLPPLTNVTAEDAQTLCNNRSSSNDRLMRRTEFIAASAWDTSLSESTITSTETGANLKTTSACNSSAAAGLAISDDFTLPTSDTDALPSATASTHRTLITGSTSTESCRSRYGVQDLVGNVREFNSDTIQCDSPSTCADDNNTTSDIDSTFMNQWYSDSTNLDDSFVLATSTAPDIVTNIYLLGGVYTSWKIATQTSSFNYFFLPYGLPSSVKGTSTPNVINGSSAPAISTAQLHDDKIAFNTSTIFSSTPSNSLTVNYGEVTSGGSFNDGSQAGRYTMDWVPGTQTDSKTGFRCIIKY
ncbi:MAG: Ig-like domain-containing protein [Bacteriovoracaceae bacterium]